MRPGGVQEDSEELIRTFPTIWGTMKVFGCWNSCRTGWTKSDPGSKSKYRGNPTHKNFHRKRKVSKEYRRQMNNDFYKKRNPNPIKNLKPKAKGKCFKCGRKGHFKKECLGKIYIYIYMHKRPKCLLQRNYALKDWFPILAEHLSVIHFSQKFYGMLLLQLCFKHSECSKCSNKCYHFKTRLQFYSLVSYARK